jgi:biopolymer transport protein ExbD
MTQEIEQHRHPGKSESPKSKKISLEVDLTPMVDLGFLLISFFVFTTTVSQPTAMKLALPNDQARDSSEAPANKTLNLILCSNNETYVYSGKQLNEMVSIGSSRTAMREAIMKKKEEIRKIYGSDTAMVVLIKPTTASTYANVVNALDEMIICGVKIYVLMDADANEFKAVKVSRIGI